MSLRWCQTHRLILLALLGVSVFLSSRSTRAVTADELAQHLGVQTWSTTVDPEPKSYVTFYFVRIVNGKAAEPLGPSSSFLPVMNHNLTVLIGPVGDKRKATIMYGGGCSRIDLPNDITFPESVGLPAKIHFSGDYALGGDYKVVDNRVVNNKVLKKTIMVTDKIEDVKNGLLIHIQFIPRDN